MTSLSTRTAFLCLFALVLFGCNDDGAEEETPTNEGQEELTYYEQCLEFVEGTFEWWEDKGCIDADGEGSGSITSREEAGDEYDDIGRFSLLFGPNYEDDQCRDSTFLSYESGALQLTHAGADNGHIIDLGSDASYEAISWGQTAADIGVEVDAQELDALFYSVEDSEPQIIRDRIEVQQGHSYLLRSSDESYDLYAKLLITNYDAGELVEFDYEVLHIEAPEVLCQRRDDVYQDWEANPADEITLYDRVTYNDFVKATFNVELGTRDLVWETRNSWHLTLDRNELHRLDDSQIADLGEVELADVAEYVSNTRDDLEFSNSQPVIEDHTYFVEGSITYAVQILEFEVDDFVTFKWLVLD